MALEQTLVDYSIRNYVFDNNFLKLKMTYFGNFKIKTSIFSSRSAVSIWRYLAFNLIFVPLIFYSFTPCDMFFKRGDFGNIFCHKKAGILELF